MNSDFSVVILGREYSKQMLELFNLVFNQSADMDFWIHKHYENPVGETIFFGIFDEDRLVAINGFMPMLFSNGSEKYRVLESCESAVNSQYRHRGLFSALISAAIEWAKENEIDFLFGMPNMFSAPGFIKLGWNAIGEAYSYGAITTCSKWLTTKKKIRPLADAMLLGRWVLNRFSTTDKRYSLSELNEDDFLELHQKCEDEVTCMYTKDYLEWKLRGKIYLIKYADENVLLLIFQDNVIVFYELLTNDDNQVRGAFRFFLKYVRNKVGSVIVFAESCKDIRMLLNKSGFVTRREPPYLRIAMGISERSKHALHQKVVINAIESD